MVRKDVSSLVGTKFKKKKIMVDYKLESWKKVFYSEKRCEMRQFEKKNGVYIYLHWYLATGGASWSSGIIHHPRCQGSAVRIPVFLFLLRLVRRIVQNVGGMDTRNGFGSFRRRRLNG